MNTPELFWAPSFSPYATFSEVPADQVGQALRQQMTRWGRPERVRVDNGYPWGNWNDLPTAFALWGVGVGLRWHWNDPYCPQQNPKIERSQGTGKRWSEPSLCSSVEQLQQHLDEADRIHREEYPIQGGRSRLELFPQLEHSGRGYSLSWEKRNWSMAAVQEHLSEYVAVRRVFSSGHVRVYNQSRYLGKQYAGHRVQVQYDPDTQEWLFSDEKGQELRRHVASEINRQQLVKMTFATK